MGGDFVAKRYLTVARDISLSSWVVYMTGTTCVEAWDTAQSPMMHRADACVKRLATLKYPWCQVWEAV